MTNDKMTVAKPNALSAELSNIIETAIGEDRGTAYREMKIALSIKDDLMRSHLTGSTDTLDTFKEIDAQIFAARITRVLYLQRDQKVANCRSVDGGQTGIPHPELGQGLGIAQGQVCETCTLNQWREETDPQTGQMIRTKKCKERRNLAAMISSYEQPVVIGIAPTGIKAWDKYVNSLVMARPKSHYIAKLTHIKIVSEKGKSGTPYGVPEFSAARDLDSDEITMGANLRDTYRDLLGALETEEVATDVTPPVEEMPF